MTIVTKWDFGQTLYLITDHEQPPRILTGIIQRPGKIQYELISGTSGSWHYDFEISEEVSILAKT